MILLALAFHHLSLYTSFTLYKHFWSSGAHCIPLYEDRFCGMASWLGQDSLLMVLKLPLVGIAGSDLLYRFGRVDTGSSRRLTRTSMPIENSSRLLVPSAYGVACNTSNTCHVCKVKSC